MHENDGLLDPLASSEDTLAARSLNESMAGARMMMTHSQDAA